MNKQWQKQVTKKFLTLSGCWGKTVHCSLSIRLAVGFYFVKDHKNQQAQNFMTHAFSGQVMSPVNFETQRKIHELIQHFILWIRLHLAINR